MAGLHQTIISTRPRLLTAALQDSDDAPDDWRSTAAGLLVFAVAGLGRRDEARRLLEEMADSSPEQLLLLVDGFGSDGRRFDDRRSAQVAELELRAAELLRARRAGLDEAARKQLELTLVDALAATGRRDEALSAADKLADEFPRTDGFKRRYAQLLLDGATESDWRAGAGPVAFANRTKCKTGGERWYRSIYAQALALQRSGQGGPGRQTHQAHARAPPGTRRSEDESQIPRIVEKVQGVTVSR